jgi:hypothetical protein
MRALVRTLIVAGIVSCVFPLCHPALGDGGPTRQTEERLFSSERKISQDAWLIDFAVDVDRNPAQAFAIVLDNLAKFALRNDFDGFVVHQSWRLGSEPTRLLVETVNNCGSRGAADCRLVVQLHKYVPGPAAKSGRLFESADGVTDARNIVLRQGASGS